MKSQSLPDGLELEPLNSEKTEETKRKIRVYRKRWLILALSCLIQFVDQIIFLSFAPVANYADSFYGAFTVNYLAMLCTACSVAGSLIAPWFGSKYGLKAVMLYPAWINTFGTVLRMCSHIPINAAGDPMPLAPRFWLTALGQALAATGTPFAVYQPSKIAAAWFPIDERALATTVSAISGLLGILFVNILCPLLVTSTEHILRLNALILGITALTALVSTVGIWRSALPSHPPSGSAADEQYEFWTGVKKIMKNKQFLILTYVMGSAIACFTSLYTLMEQMLCARGYSNQFAGLCIALLIGIGLIGALVAGFITAKWQIFEEVIKVCGSGGALTYVIFCVLALYPDMDVYLALSAAAFGAFGMAFYGVGMDAAAEISHPVAETTSAGLVVLSGFIQFIIYLVAVQFTQRPLPENKLHLEVCTILAKTGIDIEAHDMTIPLMLLSSMMTLNVFVLFIFFRPKYRRLMRENENNAKKEIPILNNSAKS